MEANLTITGNVGGDVTFHSFEGGQSAAFNLACTPRTFRDGDWRDGETTWVRVYCWRALALHVRDSVRKGDPLLVTGRLRTDRWTNDQGQAREKLTVEAITVGHDLRLGDAAFRRATRTPEERPTLESPHEAAAADAVDGGVFDAETAEDPAAQPV